jgi:hypothetical protein
MAKQVQNKHSSGVNREQRRLRWQRIGFVAMALILIFSWVASLLH